MAVFEKKGEGLAPTRAQPPPTTPRATTCCPSPLPRPSGRRLVVGLGGGALVWQESLGTLSQASRRAARCLVATKPSGRKQLPLSHPIPHLLLHHPLPLLAISLALRPLLMQALCNLLSIAFVVQFEQVTSTSRLADSLMV